MSIVAEERLSDSPYIETVTRGHTASDGAAIRPAEIHWHMVLRNLQGNVQLILVGPWTESGIVSYTDGAELLWIKFKLGICMPHLPVREFVNTETTLPSATRSSFWLKRTAWQYPDYNNVETFVDHLARADVIARDPVVQAAVHDQRPELSPRTLRYRFLQATGLSQSHIQQVQRAQQAAMLLKQGLPIPDVMFELGYYDQPHLTRSLKHFIGHTPAQLFQQARPARSERA